MDTLTQVNTLVMDKTGTVTKGTFKIKDISIANQMQEAEFMGYLLSLEKTSTHPIAKAIMQYEAPAPEASDVSEIAGKGLKGLGLPEEALSGIG